MTERGHRFFIGAATTRYHPASGLADRPELSAEVARMADLFAGQLGYERVSFGTDLSRIELITRLGEFLTHPDRTDRDLVVFYYTGHGEIRNGDLALPLPETTADFARTAVWASELVRWLFGDTPVQRFLIILDTCHAAAGGAVVARGGMDYLNSLAGLASDPSIAVLAAARPQEQAESGMFTRVFVDAVRNRATGADQLAYLPLDALVNVIRDQAPPWQHARLFLTGDGTTEFIPNPRYAERLRKLNEWIERDQRQAAIRRAETVSHVLPRAQGLDSRGEDIWLFTGRENAMRSVCRWLADQGSGTGPAPTLIVTGDPGSGKSALLSRIYVLQERRLRDRVPGIGELAEDTLPPVESVARFIHARGLTPDQVLAGLCEATGVEEARDVGDLLVALADRPVPITVIVDAVDEAATAEAGGDGADFADHPLVTTLLAPLIRAAPRSKLRLLIGTRRHLLGALGGPSDRIDLDTAGFADRSSLRNYAMQCLTRLIETSPYARQPPELTLAVADAIAAAAGDSFLVALIAARSLALRPEAVDSTDHGWRAQLPRAAADAMRADLEQRLGEDADRARDLLLPLAYGEGTGLPWEDLWPRLATAMSGRRYQNSDIDWLLDHAGYYIVHNGQTRRSAYRLYHESLAEHLRERRDHRADQRTIAEVLTAHTPAGADGRPDWGLAHPYTRSHLAGHAAHGGMLDELLGDPRFLLAADRAHLLAVLPLASSVAARSAADAYRQAAYSLRNRAPAEHAAYLQLAARCGRAADLADAITNSTLKLPWSARWARWRPQHPHRVLRGHTGKVFAVAVGLHDGRVIAASAGQDNTVGLWDLATGHAWGSGALGHESVVTCAAFARFDGRLYLVTGTEGHHVQVWVSAGNGFVLHRKLVGHTDAVSAVAATTVAGRPLILSGAADGTARLWDLGTGQPVGRPYTGHLGEVTAAAFHNGIAVTASADTTVHVWDPRTGQRVFRPLTGHKASVRAVAIARRHGRPIAVTAGDDRTIQLWDLGTGEAVREPLTGHTDWVRSLAAAEVDGRPVLVSGGDDRTVRVWDLESGEPIGAGFRGHVGWVRGVAACEIDTRVVAVSASDDRTLRVWDLHGMTELDNPLAGHTDVVRGVATARVGDRTVAVTCGDDRSVRLWDLHGRKPLGEPLTEHRDWIQAVATTVVDGRPTAVTAGTEGAVRIWDLERQAHVGRPLRGHVGTAWSVATAELAGLPVAVTSGEDTTIRLWDLRAGVATGKVMRGHLQRIRAVTTGELDGRPVAVSGSDDRTVRVWDLLSGERAGPVMRGHTDWIRALTLTTLDGRPVVVTAGDDAMILSWDLHTGSRAGPPMLGHRGEIWSLAGLTLHDRPAVLSAGQDRTVRVFDLMTGEMLAQPFAGHSDRIRSMAICDLDGRPIVVAAGDDRIVRMWDLLADAAADGSIAAHNAWVRSAALAQVGGRQVVMTGGDDGTIRVWDLAQGATAAPPFIGHTGWVYSVAAGRIEDTPVGVSGSDDRSMRIFDIASGSEMGVLLEAGPRQPRRMPKKPGGKQKARAERAPVSRVPPIRAVAVHEFRNGRVVAVGAGDDAVIRAWDLGNGLELTTARIGHSARILTMALDERPDGQPLLITGSLDGTARLWCLTNPPDTTQTMTGHDGAVQSVAFARFPDRLAVVTAGADRTVRVWDAASAAPIGPPIVGHTGSVLAVAATWFLGRPVAVTGGADGTVRVSDLTTYEAIQDIELNAVVLGLAVRPDGLVIATTSEGVVAIDLRGTRD